jgi:hypothetical protein
MHIFSRPAQFLDSLISKKSNLDNACGLFFIGTKLKNKRKLNNEKWIIDYYSQSS